MNATGPQGDRVAAQLLGGALPRLVPVLSLALNVVTRPLGLDAAVGGMARGRLFFAAPWRGVTIAGTSHEPYEGDARTARSCRPPTSTRSCATSTWRSRAPA